MVHSKAVPEPGSGHTCLGIRLILRHVESSQAPAESQVQVLRVLFDAVFNRAFDSGSHSLATRTLLTSGHRSGARR